MGSIQVFFDGDIVLVSRGEMVNLFQVILDFVDPCLFSGVMLIVGGQSTRVIVIVMVKGLFELVIFIGEVQFFLEIQVIDLFFEVRLFVSCLMIEILSFNDVEFIYVYVWEIVL